MPNNRKLAINKASVTAGNLCAKREGGSRGGTPYNSETQGRDCIVAIFKCAVL